MKLSPMMRQYFAIKKEHKDCILFFRVGDFYEMFFDDAILASKELELTLTGKSCGREERAPMCGFPHHSADTYIYKLVERGYKVAICEQTEDPAKAKGIVKRDVIKIITPGTITSGLMLEEGENNYLAALYISKKGLSISYCDISTGELYTTEEEEDPDLYNSMLDELIRIAPKEILIQDDFDSFYGSDRLKDLIGASISILGKDYFLPDAALDILAGLLGESYISSSGIKDKRLALCSLSALLSYLLETQKNSLSQITECRYFSMGCNMSLDIRTLRNLEILETIYDKKKKGSLLYILDRTGTAPGARLLKKWLKQPLNDSKAINKRLDAVEDLVRDPLILNNLSEALKQVYDFERLAAKIGSGTANARDLLALGRSIGMLPVIKEEICNMSSDLLASMDFHLDRLEGLNETIENAISEDPPLTVKEGGIIRSGYSEELDALKHKIKDAKKWIAGLEVSEKERTGIKSLKVGYNKVFGYYIDVTKSNLHLVPDNYIRKQTLVNSERYIIPELKEAESLVLNAEVKVSQMEYEIFTELREKLGAYVHDLQKASAQVATLDVLTSFAEVSIRNAYVRPDVNDSRKLLIEAGRHPVVEESEKDNLFVSNDTYLDNEDNSLMLITGPNMSGKSTYMRQTALIVLMAQAGSFVPCDRAEIGVVDRIFTRIGASDNLSKGESTFYVEMSELSYILHSAGERSLIILDEIGRGTSTYDGLSIAWATIEFLGKRHIRTLFASHYHELTMLEGIIPGFKNLNVDVAEENGSIVFLHKIVPGKASRSYGIHVAKLAGVPGEVLLNAQKKLDSLEKDDKNKDLINDMDRAAIDNSIYDDQVQLSFFDLARENKLIEKLKSIDLMEIKASEAIKILEDLQSMVGNE
jgi:DNA mismatch repair protein MutS